MKVYEAVDTHSLPTVCEWEMRKPLSRDARIRPEVPTSAGDGRTAFERDRDRILYTAHFRRLAGVTQVTTPTELQSFHNRLTHTLEVAQVARRMAERLLRKRSDDTALRNILDPTVCESAALAHDLGHPPFGHNGEKCLDKLALEADSTSDGFEGNAQSLRIISQLANREGDSLGLNLSTATLRASIKYPWLRDRNPAKPNKFGVYQSENALFEPLWDGYPEFNQVLEAQVMDWADDIAYSTHDFYDFVISGLIPISVVRTWRWDELRDLLASEVDTTGIGESAYKRVCQSFNLLPNSISSFDSRLSSPNVGQLRSWVSFWIGECTDTSLTISCQGNLEFINEIDDQIRILKGLTYYYAIGSPALAVRQEGEQRILGTLFEILLNDARGKKRYLNVDARKRIETDGCIRVVLDVISSMTDHQAIAMHQKLTGLSTISILDVTTPSAF